MNETIILAIIQAATEFLPVSSSGHLAIFGNLFYEIDLFYITFLHLASLFAIIIYTRKEIFKLITFDEKYKQMWIYILIGILPASIIGLFFRDFIELTFSSFFAIGIAYFFTGTILLISYKFNEVKGLINKQRSFAIGVSQILALFPGISRSGTTISFGLFSGLNKEEAFKFSFLMSIPLIIGAMLVELRNFYISTELIIGFFVCFIFSLIFLNLLHIIIKKNYFWVFGFYCYFLSIVSFYLFFR